LEATGRSHSNLVRNELDLDAAHEPLDFVGAGASGAVRGWLNALTHFVSVGCRRPSATGGVTTSRSWSNRRSTSCRPSMITLTACGLPTTSGDSTPKPTRSSRHGHRSPGLPPNSQMYSCATTCLATAAARQHSARKWPPRSRCSPRTGSPWGSAPVGAVTNTRHTATTSPSRRCASRNWKKSSRSVGPCGPKTTRHSKASTTRSLALQRRRSPRSRRPCASEPLVKRLGSPRWSHRRYVARHRSIVGRARHCPRVGDRGRTRPSQHRKRDPDREAAAPDRRRIRSLRRASRRRHAAGVDHVVLDFGNPESIELILRFSEQVIQALR
jgi:hypothetical protein